MSNPTLIVTQLPGLLYYIRCVADILQSNERRGYCSVPAYEVGSKYYIGKKHWRPPLNDVSDLLLMGRKGPTSKRKVEFRVFSTKRRKMRGCGHILERFGDDQTLAVARGLEQHFGYSYLLRWR